MDDHIDEAPETMTEADEISISDYVDNAEDQQEIAIQLCSLLSAAGTSVNESGAFVMDSVQLQAFAVLLRRNRVLAGKKVRKYYKRRSRRVLDQIPDDDIEKALTSDNRGERDRFGLGTTLRGKVVVIHNKLPLSELPPLSAEPDQVEVEHTFAVGEVVLTLAPDGNSYWPGEIFNSEAAPPIVRVLRPDDDGQHYLVAVYPHGGFGWFTGSRLWRTDAAQLKRLEELSSDRSAKTAFRIAQNPAKWRKTFNASLRVMVEARNATDIEHEDKPKPKEESAAPEDKDTVMADGDEDGSQADGEPNYEDLQPHRQTRALARLLGPERFEVGELVLGKLKGHPPWPGKIADPHQLPLHIALQCPDRDDHDVYPIRFFPDGDYWWVNHNDITRLDMERVAKFVRETRANFGTLLEGYKIARDPSAWEAANPTPEDIVDLYKIEMPEKPKPKVPEPKVSHKRKRGQHRDESGTPQPGKKRKRGDGDGDDSKPRKKRDGKGQTGPNGNVKDEPAEAMDVDQRPPMSPRTAALAALSDKEGKIQKIRWLLQKTFLSGERINDSKFPDASRVLDELAADQEMTGYFLKKTKVQKVLVGVSRLEFIRNEGEWNFRERALNLLKQWERIPNPKYNSQGEPIPDLDFDVPKLAINTQLPALGHGHGHGVTWSIRASAERAEHGSDSGPRGMSTGSLTPAALLSALPSVTNDTPTQDHA